MSKARDYADLRNDLDDAAFSGNYSDLEGLPTIPTALSQLTNDPGYLTNETHNASPYFHFEDLETSTYLQLYLTTVNKDLGSYQNLYHRSTPEDASRFVDVDFSTYWNHTSSSVNDIRLTCELTVPAGATIHTLGTLTEVVTAVSATPYTTRSSSEKWYYVSGDKTHLFTKFGAVSKRDTGGYGYEQNIRAWQYVPGEDKTYLLASYAMAYMSTGDTAYWHPYAWESQGSTLYQWYDFSEKYRAGTENNKVTFKLAFDNDTLLFKLKIREMLSTDSAQVHSSRVRLNSMGL